MLNYKTLPPSGPLSYFHGSELKTWTSYWKREGSIGMDMWNAPTVQSRQPLTYRLMVSVGLGGPRWLGSSWQRGIADSGSSLLSTLMIETPGDLVWDLPCMQQASCLKRAHCCGYGPCTCMLIKNPMMMMMLLFLLVLHFDKHSLARTTPISNIFSWFQGCSSHWSSTIYVFIFEKCFSVWFSLSQWRWMYTVSGEATPPFSSMPCL